MTTFILHNFTFRHFHRSLRLFGSQLPFGLNFLVIHDNLVSMKKRRYYKEVWAAFNQEKHLILVSGPRQAGKTIFAKQIASEEPVSLYFNYDIPANKAKILQNPTFFDEMGSGHDKNLIYLEKG